MNILKKNRGIFLSVASTLISVITLCLVAFRSKPLTLDWMGILVGVLALLVTALIGWQIYVFVDINRKAKELAQLTAEAHLKTEKSLALSEDAAAGVYYYLLLKEDPLGLEYQFLYHRVSSLFHTSNFNDIETCNIIVKVILEVLIDPTQVNMIQACKDRLLVLLTKVQHTDKITGYSELVEKIAKINVIPRKAETQS